MLKTLLAVVSLSLSLGILTPRCDAASAAAPDGASVVASVSVRQVIELRGGVDQYTALTNSPLGVSVTQTDASSPVAQLR